MNSDNTQNATEQTIEINTPTDLSTVIKLRIRLTDETVSEAVTQPYIREANDTDQLPAGIANRGFTIVLPAFKEEIYDELLFTFSNADNSSAILSTLIPFQSGVDSIDTVVKDEISKEFKRGDQARIRVFLRVYGEIWVQGKDSIVYTIV